MSPPTGWTLQQPGAGHSSQLRLRRRCLLQAGRFREYMATHSSGVWWIVVATSAVALSYNIVHSEMIKRTSAVTTTVLGEVKIVGLMLLSFLLLGAPLLCTSAGWARSRRHASAGAAAARPPPAEHKAMADCWSSRLDWRPGRLAQACAGADMQLAHVGPGLVSWQAHLHGRQCSLQTGQL